MVDGPVALDGWRELTLRAFSDCTGSSREGLLFCSLDWLLVVGSWDEVVVGVIDRLGNRVVGVLSSILLGGPYCDL
jgi:hypothetical protein